MRTEILLQKDWVFTDMDGVSSAVDLPHTWNAIDGQDGGNDYRRGVCHYKKTFVCPEFDREKQCVYLEFQGVNASALVELNGKFEKNSKKFGVAAVEDYPTEWTTQY